MSVALLFKSCDCGRYFKFYHAVIVVDYADHDRVVALCLRLVLRRSNVEVCEPRTCTIARFPVFVGSLRSEPSTQDKVPLTAVSAQISDA